MSRMQKDGRPPRRGAGVDPRRWRPPTAAHLLLGLLAVGLAGAAGAQVIQLSSEGRYSQPIRRGLPEYRGGFMFCRLWYDQGRLRSMPSGAGWSTDYPAGENNFMTRLEELTHTHLSLWNDGTVGHAAVQATDPDLFKCPFLMMSDPGSYDFTDAEVERLREYLLKGGFLWTDDMWGDQAWGFLSANLARILPEYEYVELTPEHPLFSAQYIIDRIPQIPSIRHWRRFPDDTSEFGPETATPHLRAIFDRHGRLLVLSSVNTDIADGWEREGHEIEYFYRFSPPAYALGINVALWIMSR